MRRKREVYTLERALYTNVDKKEIQKYNIWKRYKLVKTYLTSNRSYDYINYIYKIKENIFGYLQLKGRKYEETFKVEEIQLDFKIY